MTAADIYAQGTNPTDGARHHARKWGTLALSCSIYHREAALDNEAWPDGVPVPAFGPYVGCTRSGMIGRRRANWNERAPRSSLPEMQWRRSSRHRIEMRSPRPVGS